MKLGHRIKNKHFYIRHSFAFLLGNQSICFGKDVDSTTIDSKRFSMVKFLKYMLPLIIVFSIGTAHAERLENQVAVFSALEKITATIKNIEIPINETVSFGVFEVTPRVCYTRTAIELPQTTAFVEIDEVSTDKTKLNRIFTGWMFASSPGLHGVEHPVYDIWLVGCKSPIK